MENTVYFTSESVSCGHPDKICDQISDAILDEYIKKDKNAKVAIECFITENLLVIGGEVFGCGIEDVDPVFVAKNKIAQIGYNGTNGFDPENATYINSVHGQSADIRVGVERKSSEEQGAGDQGIMFGYACDETKDYMPVAITLANSTMRIYDEIRRNKNFLNPDAKCQYTIKYCKGKPIAIDTFLISMQHTKKASKEMLYKFVINELIPKVVAENKDLENLFGPSMKILINPTGKFVIGGPEGDTGLTGRKIIVDTYGGSCPHGGGAFSGKDSSKVDRSAAYAARYIAKNLVASGICRKATVQLSYAIGLAKPVSIFVKTDSGEGLDEKLPYIIRRVFPLTPHEIVEHFNLLYPIYSHTSVYGHFGNNAFPWERTDKIGEIFEAYQEINSKI